MAGWEAVFLYLLTYVFIFYFCQGTLPICPSNCRVMPKGLSVKLLVKYSHVASRVMKVLLQEESGLIMPIVQGADILLMCLSCVEVRDSLSRLPAPGPSRTGPFSLLIFIYATSSGELILILLSPALMNPTVSSSGLLPMI